MQAMNAEPLSVSLPLALQQLAEVASIDRASVYELRHPGQDAPPAASLVAEWRMERRASALAGAPLSGPDWDVRWYADLRRDRVVEGPGQDLGPSPAHASAAQSQAGLGLLPQSALAQAPRRRSVVAVPIDVEGDLWGFLRLDFIRAEILWTEQHEAVARSFTRFLGIVQSVQTRHHPREAAVTFSLDQLAREHEIAFELDTKGNWSFLSPAWDQLTGYPAKRAVGSHHAHYLFQFSDATGSGLERLDLLQGIGNSGTHGGEGLLKADDGSHFWVSFLITMLPASDGVPVRYQGVLVDIQERKAREEREKATALELQAKNAELLTALMAAQEATRLQGNFLATMSHEIRTPLNGVLGMTSLLLQTSLDRQQREFGLAIQSSAESLLSIVNSILDYSKLEAQRVDLEEVYYDPRELVEEVCGSLAEPASRKRIDLVVHTRFPVPALVLGDPGKVRQVLLNLIGNAIKFSKKGEVGIVVSWEALLEPAGELRFEVIDFGIGMTEQTLDRLFRPFSQAEPATSRIYGGTGLGLAISKHLCELMGGEILAESQLGSGSRFQVVLRTTGRAIAASGWKCPGEMEAFRGKRVMLAGFGELSAQAWFVALGESGLHAQRSQGLRDTVELLSNEAAAAPTDVVVFDTHSLEGGGPEINRGIRLATRNPHLLLVLLDSIHDPVDRSAVKGVDPLLVLRKPISPYRALSLVAAAHAALTQTPRKPMQRLVKLSREPNGAMSPCLVFSASESRRKGLGYLLRRFGLGMVAAENFQDLLQRATGEDFALVILDADLGVQSEMEVAERLRSTLGGAVPPLVAVSSSNPAREQLQLSGLFDAVLEEGFQREDLRRVAEQFASQRLILPRASAS
ncbi:MAG: ATP-binding protein [Bryobacterales bacterium]|nr:ATP-binding protein [Bryobacterales bacterium]